MNESELYDKLMTYSVSEQMLERYGYPCRDPCDYRLRKKPSSISDELRSQFRQNYRCFRCNEVYEVDANGMPKMDRLTCEYHNGKPRGYNYYNRRYTCCSGDVDSTGCKSTPNHVHRGELELANYQGYVETQDKPERDPNRHGVYALDCEMCYTTYGLELIRVTLINHKFDVVYEKLVKPSNPILDYNTKLSGISQSDLNVVSTRLADVQRDLLELFSSKTILVGHGIDNDMKALKIFHKRFVDTLQLYPHSRGWPYKRALKDIVKEYLKYNIQTGDGHDSKEDAVAAFRLVMHRAQIPD